MAQHFTIMHCCHSVRKLGLNQAKLVSEEEPYTMMFSTLNSVVYNEPERERLTLSVNQHESAGLAAALLI